MEGKQQREEADRLETQKMKTSQEAHWRYLQKTPTVRVKVKNTTIFHRNKTEGNKV